MAATLIALKRLGYADINTLLDSLLSRQTPKERIATVLEGLLAIINGHDDNTVFSNQAIGNHVQTWLNGPGRKYTRQQADKNNHIRDLARNIIAISKQTSNPAIARQLRGHNNKDTDALQAKTEPTQKEPRTRKALTTLVSNTNANITQRRLALKFLINNNAKISGKLLSKITRNINDPLALDAIQNLKPDKSTSTASYLWSLLDNRAIPVNIRFAAAFALLPSNKKRVLTSSRAIINSFSNARTGTQAVPLVDS